MRPYLERLTARRDLSTEEAASAVAYAVSGKADAAEVGAFLALLSAKGESVDEIAGVATAMRERMVPVSYHSRVLDIVGTGGDGADTVNISTAASIVAAAAGCKVAKHGNRSVSSKCGSADVLEELGISLSLSPDGVAECIDKSGIGFMFAPNHHPAMKFVSPVRKSLKIRTIFNIMGPLLNPAQASCGVIGVYSPALLDNIADTLIRLGVQHALVVHTEGLDELSNTGIASIIEIRDGKKSRRSLDASVECRLPRCSVHELKGGDAGQNACIIRQVLSGSLTGPVADAIALNAGAGIYVYGLESSLANGVQRAREMLSSGAALNTLENWAAASRSAEKAVKV